MLKVFTANIFISVWNYYTDTLFYFFFTSVVGNFGFRCQMDVHNAFIEYIKKKEYMTMTMQGEGRQQKQFKYIY